MTTESRHPPNAAAPDLLEEVLLQALRWFDLPMSGVALRARAAKLPGPWSLGDLCEAAESLGLRAHRQHRPAQQADLADLPILLGLDGGGMLLVTAQSGPDHWQAWVPGVGLQTVEAKAWLPRLNGEQVVLSRQAHIDRSPNAEPQGRYGHWFWGPLGMARSLYVQVGVAALLTNLFAVTTSIFSMIVYDRVIPNNAQDTLVALLIGVVVVFLSDFAIRSLRGYFLDVAGARADLSTGALQLVPAQGVDHGEGGMLVTADAVGQRQHDVMAGRSGEAELAVRVISMALVGAAFGAIVTSLVTDVVMPIRGANIGQQPKGSGIMAQPKP